MTTATIQEITVIEDMTNIGFVPYRLKNHPGNWEDDFKYENGLYSNKCLKCDQEFLGHKYRRVCRSCSPNPWIPGTIFTIRAWRYVSTWVTIEDIDDENAICFRLSGTDPRMFPKQRKFTLYKSLFRYGGKVRKNLLLELLVFFKYPKVYYTCYKNKKLRFKT